MLSKAISRLVFLVLLFSTNIFAMQPGKPSASAPSSPNQPSKIPVLNPVNRSNSYNSVEDLRKNDTYWFNREIVNKLIDERISNPSNSNQPLYKLYIYENNAYQQIYISVEKFDLIDKKNNSHKTEKNNIAVEVSRYVSAPVSSRGLLDVLPSHARTDRPTASQSSNLGYSNLDPSTGSVLISSTNKSETSPLPETTVVSSSSSTSSSSTAPLLKWADELIQNLKNVLPTDSGETKTSGILSPSAPYVTAQDLNARADEFITAILPDGRKMSLKELKEIEAKEASLVAQKIILQNLSKQEDIASEALNKLNSEFPAIVAPLEQVANSSSPSISTISMSPIPLSASHAELRDKAKDLIISTMFDRLPTQGTDDVVLPVAPHSTPTDTPSAPRSNGVNHEEEFSAANTFLVKSLNPNSVESLIDSSVPSSESNDTTSNGHSIVSEVNSANVTTAVSTVVATESTTTSGNGHFTDDEHDSSSSSYEEANEVDTLVFMDSSDSEEAALFSLIANNSNTTAGFIVLTPPQSPTTLREKGTVEEISHGELSGEENATVNPLLVASLNTGVSSSASVPASQPTIHLLSPAQADNLVVPVSVTVQEGDVQAETPAVTPPVITESSYVTMDTALNVGVVVAGGVAVVTYSKDIKDGAKSAQVKYFTTEAWEDVKHLIECDVIIPMLETIDEIEHTVSKKFKDAYHHKKIAKKDAAIICGAIAAPIALYYTGAVGATKKIVKKVSAKTFEVIKNAVTSKATKGAFIASCAGLCGYKVYKNKTEKNLAKIKKELLVGLQDSPIADLENFEKIQSAIEKSNVADLIDLRNDPNVAQFLNSKQQKMIDDYLAMLVYTRV